MTEPGPAFVDDDKLEVKRAIVVGADREKVWRALTEPALIEQWFGDSAALDGSTVGSTGIFGWEGYGTSPIEVVESVPHEVFAFRWIAMSGDVLTAENSTVARFTLEDHPKGTLLTVVESGFSSLAGDDAEHRELAEGNREGWDMELDELKTFVENEAGQ